MRVEEAKYVGEKVKQLILGDKVVVLNLGSSTNNFRKNTQPHIHKNIFAPLEELNVRVVHSDLKELDGVDISGDVFDPETQEKLRKLNPNVVLACNIMEHLEKDVRNKFPQILSNIVKLGGVVILTVPYSYPLHLDPIDTYYRPSPAEIASLFPSFDTIDSQVLASTSYFAELSKQKIKEKLKLIIRIFLPFYKPMTWLCIVHRFLWLFRPYKVSCVILKKSEPGSAAN